MSAGVGETAYVDDVRGIDIVLDVYVENVMKYSFFCLLAEKRWHDPGAGDGYSIKQKIISSDI